MGQTTPRIPREQKGPAKDKTGPSSPTRRGGRGSGPSTFVTVLRGATLVLLAVVGIGIGFMMRSKTARTIVPAIINNIIHHKTPSDVFPGQDSINLMIIGRDYDYTDKDQIIKSNARSDLLMVAHLDFANDSAHLLSIPRDTRADIPTWENVRAHVGKINAAHAIGGPKLSEETVQDMFGIQTDKYVAIDFEGFEKAIDELGGVDCVVDRKMDYDDNWGHLHIHLKPGFQHLDGQDAMGFVRFRHADSDFVRVKRQQTLLAALKEKLRDPFVLTHLPNILETLNNHMDSDLSTDQKVVLGNFLHSVPRGQIQMSTLPSLEGSGTFVMTDWSKATPMIESIFGVSPPSHLASRGNRSRRRRRHHAV